MTTVVVPDALPFVPAPTARKRSLWQRIIQNRWGYVFIAPWLVATIVFNWYPIVASVRYAFYNWTGFGEPDQFVGFRHFENVLGDSFFWGAVGNAIRYTGILVPVQLVLALVLAITLNNRRLRFANFFRAGFFIPAVCSTVVLAVPIRYLIGFANKLVPESIVNAGLFNPTLGFLQDPRYALLTIIVFGVWQYLGYNMVLFLAALQTVPEELYDAATIDGAGLWQKFIYITIPVIRPVAVLITLLAILGSMKVFDSVLVLTNGGPFFSTEVPQTYIYHNAFAVQASVRPNLGYASAASLIYSLLLLGLTVAQLFVVRWNRSRREKLGLRQN
jgi:ABC-type sugar transport system permease subunit